MTEETYTKIEALIRRNFFLPTEPLPRERLLRGSPQHELWVLSLVMDLEDTFWVDVTDEEEAALRTVGDAMDLIDGKLSAAV